MIKLFVRINICNIMIIKIEGRYGLKQDDLPTILVQILIFYLLNSINEIKERVYFCLFVVCVAGGRKYLDR